MASEARGGDLLIRNKRYGGDWDITWEEYKELSYFCLQYNRKKQEAENLLTLRVSTATETDAHGNGVLMPRGKGGTSDPVAVQAAKRARLLQDVGLIEKAARIAGDDLWLPLLRAVTMRDGMRIVKAQFPACERSMWFLRRKFFYTLKQLRENAQENGIVK